MAEAVRGTVLIVDDQEMVRSMVADLLGGLNYRVVTAEDGEDAVRAFEEAKERARHGDVDALIDLIILDMILPHMDGREIYWKLKEIDPNVKVIVSSGYEIDTAIREMLEQGAVDFIQKPYHIETLLNMVRKHLN